MQKKWQKNTQKLKLVATLTFAFYTALGIWGAKNAFALSKQTTLCIVNLSGLDIENIRVSNLDDYDWDDYRPDRNFQDVAISNNNSRCAREEINTFASSSPYTMTLKFSNGTNLTFRNDQRNALVKHNQIYNNVTGTAQNNLIINQTSGGGTNAMYIRPGKEPDNTNWMSELLKIKPKVRLNEITMPGSHDAGMYSTSDCKLSEPEWARTQRDTITNQLRRGSRYFDLRVYYDGSDYRIGHFGSKASISAGCYGPTLTDVLNQVKTFIQSKSGHSETIVLKFSHTMIDSPEGYSVDKVDKVTKYVIPQVKEVFGSYLYTSQNRDELAKTLLSDMSGKVVTVFDTEYKAHYNLQKGVFPYRDVPATGYGLSVFDRYSGTNSYPVMSADQLNKLANYGGYGRDYLFLLSWTLTASSIDPLDVQVLSTLANPWLPQILTNIQNNSLNSPNIIFYDFVDPYINRVIINLNQPQY